MNYFVNNDRGKNEYQSLGDVRGHTLFRSALGSFLMVLGMTLLLLSTWNYNKSINLTTNTRVFHLSSRQSLLHMTSKKYLSFGLDSSLLRNMKELPILNEKFINLARHLSPAYVRVGGTSADCLYFNQTIIGTSREAFSPVDDQDISNFTITTVDFEDLYNFATKAQLRMIFDLNVLIRTNDNSWNDTNARDIISFAKERGMELDWQLGNEPNSFHHVFNVTVTATQLANDYYRLRTLLNEAGYNESLLVGPEVNHIGDTNHAGELYAKTFLEHNKDSVNYITWHQYYLNGREARVEDFVNPATFNYLPMQINSIKKILQSTNKDILMWLSETSTAYGGGAPELSNKFVAGFLWLDKLGYSATQGLNVVTRQSFFGGYYAMVESDLTPNPDWWLSVVYKHFVSEKVLKLTSEDNFGLVRLYAHCAPESTFINRVPAITIYGVNINRVPIQVIIKGLLPILHKDAKIFFYALTSDRLQSSNVRMNGEVLKLQSNGDLPPFRPVILNPTQTITLPPYSMVFMVIHGAQVTACFP